VKTGPHRMMAIFDSIAEAERAAAVLRKAGIPDRVIAILPLHPDDDAAGAGGMDAETSLH
jgi:hypothetical protein